MPTDELDQLGTRVLREVNRPGETVEVYLKRTWWRHVVRRDGSLVTDATGMETGVGIRIFLEDGRWAHVHCSDPGEEAIRAAIDQAGDLAAAREVSPTKTLLPDTAHPVGEVGSHSLEDDGREFLSAVEEEIRRADPRGGTLPLAICADGITRIWLGNSRGLEGGFSRGQRHVILGIHFPGGPGISYYRRAAAPPAALVAAEVAREAVQRAGYPLRTPSSRSGRVPIVLPPGVASELVCRLHPQFIGPHPAWSKKDSIGSRELHLVDDGTLPGAIGTAPFDGEGWESSRKILVREGIVETVISGSRQGNLPAGEARGSRVRESYREPPAVAATNFFVPAGETDPGQLTREVGDGIQVLNWEWSGGVPLHAGRFQIGFSGCAIANGEIGGGIRRGFLSGDRNFLLRGITGRGNDLRFYPLDGSFGSPTLVIEGMEVGR